MPDHALVRHLHAGLVALTLALFVVRLGWSFAAPERLGRRWVRVVPHVVDTALLLSGAWLAFAIGGAGVAGWLPAKLAALILYIVLGAVALRRGRSRRVRIVAAAGALATFGYIVSVALTKSPLGALTLAR